jgi:hypothetical protein
MSHLKIFMKFCSDSVSLVPSKMAKCRIRAATFLGFILEIKLMPYVKTTYVCLCVCDLVSTNKQTVEFS